MSTTEPDPRKVFVVHGRDQKSREAIFTFLRAINLSPMEWSDAIDLTGRVSPYIGEILDAAFGHARAVLVLMTPDDLVHLRPELSDPRGEPEDGNATAQARPNVLFEAGIAMGRDSARTILVECGNLRPFSDIAGRHVLRMDNSVARRQELARLLRKAGCDVNTSGTDWHTAGDFEVAAPTVPTVESSLDERDHYRRSTQLVLSARERLFIIERTPTLLLREFRPTDYKRHWHEVLEGAALSAIPHRVGLLFVIENTALDLARMNADDELDFEASVTRFKHLERFDDSKEFLLDAVPAYFGSFIVSDSNVGIWHKSSDKQLGVYVSNNRTLADEYERVFREMAGQKRHSAADLIALVGQAKLKVKGVQEDPSRKSLMIPHMGQ